MRFIDRNKQILNKTKVICSKTASKATNQTSNHTIQFYLYYSAFEMGFDANTKVSVTDKTYKISIFMLFIEMGTPNQLFSIAAKMGNGIVLF